MVRGIDGMVFIASTGVSLLSHAGFCFERNILWIVVSGGKGGLLVLQPARTDYTLVLVSNEASIILSTACG